MGFDRDSASRNEEYTAQIRNGGRPHQVSEVNQRLFLHPEEEEKAAFEPSMETALKSLVLIGGYTDQEIRMLVANVPVHSKARVHKLCSVGMAAIDAGNADGPPKNRKKKRVNIQLIPLVMFGMVLVLGAFYLVCSGCGDGTAFFRNIGLLSNKITSLASKAGMLFDEIRSHLVKILREGWDMDL